MKYHKSSQKTVQLDKAGKKEQMANSKPSGAAMKHFKHKPYSVGSDSIGADSKDGE